MVDKIVCVWWCHDVLWLTSGYCWKACTLVKTVNQMDQVLPEDKIVIGQKNLVICDLHLISKQSVLTSEQVCATYCPRYKQREIS